MTLTQINDMNMYFNNMIVFSFENLLVNEVLEQNFLFSPVSPSHL